jgi:hypothetical protein
MGDPAPAPIVDRPSDPLIYRPLSGVALGGFALACFFGGLVLISTLLALFLGMPFFLPGWMVILPAAGAVLSLMGRRHVRNAEGTRAGERLARWGLGLSVFVGLGYYAYVAFTGLAITQQANTFLTVKGDDSGFFPRLAEGGQEVNYAFLLSLPPGERFGARPNDPAAMHTQFAAPTAQAPKGLLPTFLGHPLVVSLMSADKDSLQVEALGVKEWKYENRGYHVTRTYRVSIPQAVMEIVATVQSTEGVEEGESRKWFVNVQQMQRISMELTPLGENLRNLRQSATVFLGTWADSLAQGKPWDEFAKKDQTRWERAQPNLKLREEVREEITRVFAGQAKNRVSLVPSSDDAPRAWTKDSQGRVLLTVPFTLRVGNPRDQRTIQGEGFLYVRTQGLYDPHNPPPQRPQWTITGIEITGAMSMTPDEMGRRGP